MWTCGDCGETNGAITHCSGCAEPRPEQAKPDIWLCDHCTAMNPADGDSCSECGRVNTKGTIKCVACGHMIPSDRCDTCVRKRSPKRLDCSHRYANGRKIIVHACRYFLEKPKIKDHEGLCPDCSYDTDICTWAQSTPKNYQVTACDAFKPKTPTSSTAVPVPPAKTPFELADLDFLAAMCFNFSRGIKEGRVANGWKDLPRDEAIKEQYRAKLMRHLHAGEWAAVACNANVLWHLERGDG